MNITRKDIFVCEKTCLSGKRLRSYVLSRYQRPPLLRNGIEELGHAGCEGFAGELADGVSLVVFGENLV